MDNPFHPDRKRAPRVVTVLGVKIQVRTFKKLQLDGHDLLGRFESDKMQISLLRQDGWRKILLHEILHCILYLAGSGEGLTVSREEQICSSIENGLFPFIKGR